MKKKSKISSLSEKKKKKKFHRPVLVVKQISDTVTSEFSVFANYAGYDYSPYYPPGS